jgi:hypothetical protein
MLTSRRATLRPVEAQASTTSNDASHPRKRALHAKLQSLSL